MLRLIRKWWSDVRFDAVISHRREIAAKMLEEHGPPTEKEKADIVRAMAIAIVERNQGEVVDGEVERVEKLVIDARGYIAKLFEQDGCKPDFAAALAHVCVAWDWNTYINRTPDPNLTLNYLLKVNTPYAGLFNEKMLFGKQRT